MIPILKPDPWQADAACRGVPNPEIFWQENNTESVDAALWLCQRCPVIRECAEYEQRMRPRSYFTWGIWGGKTTKQRLNPNHAAKPRNYYTAGEIARIVAPIAHRLNPLETGKRVTKLLPKTAKISGNYAWNHTPELFAIMEKLHEDYQTWLAWKRQGAAAFTEIIEILEEDFSRRFTKDARKKTAQKRKYLKITEVMPKSICGWPLYDLTKDPEKWALILGISEHEIPRIKNAAKAKFIKIEDNYE